MTAERVVCSDASFGGHRRYRARDLILQPASFPGTYLNYMPAAAAKPAKGKKQTVEANSAAVSVESAEEAGLRYVTDEQPGYTRKAKGDGFDYFDTAGKPIRDEPRVLRINRLAIPPAYKDVWICPSPNGHLQATGRDARGRKQYRYHERWREARDETKYDRMLPFATALPKMRRRINADLGLPGLPRNKVLATVLSIMQRTFIRIGNEEYARDNKSFGLTTMRNRHVDVKGATLRFTFRGKSGVSHEVDVDDRRLAKIVRKMEDLPGQEIFAYVDEEGVARDVKSQDVNEYLRETSGDDFTAKDFRTWAGTVLAAVALHALEQAETETAAKKNITAAITAVSKILGNTPAVCRKSYVHPAVLEAYLTGSPIEGLKHRTEEALEEKLEYLRSEEAAVMSFLQAKLAEAKA